jgi:hypothetical protein
VVLEGALDFTTGKDTYRLEPGDSFSVASNQPHRVANPSADRDRGGSGEHADHTEETNSLGITLQFQLLDFDNPAPLNPANPGSQGMSALRTNTH